MKQINHFLKLPSNRQGLIIKTIFLMWIIRITTSLVPFKYTQSFIKKLSRPKKAVPKKYSVDELIWAVEMAANYVIRATCLIKALTGQILLTEENYKPELKIGVLKNNQNEFKAHAWLVVSGKTIMGKSDKKYTSLLEMR